MVPVTNRTGQPLAFFLFTQTITTAPPAPATAVLDVRIQNGSNCTLSFPYTLTLSSRGPGQLVDYELPGTVTSLPVRTVVQAHHVVATTAFPLHTAGIVITSHGEPVRTECPSLGGSWTGPYSLFAEDYEDDWAYGPSIPRPQEDGSVYVTVPAAGGPLEIRYVRLTATGQPTGASTRLVGTLTPDDGFSGQDLTRGDNGVVDTVQAAGLLRLGEPDPVSGQPQLQVGLRLKSAKSPADVLVLQALVKRP
ncbi:hypothetical protein SAMN00120144_2156 [Hymenobacter roseosalivarius DSM 11622]|uniref:Uncharacterized protein n=1 Tax=Hymenobacter roseosalivarius DSM 11622 TaxID=645990 RepID=A0A1W1VG94_9BACT|nr:hypothetical protein [Hymenobacter roseosalivarius]SMB92429.1 hypothetical protein SAMN00120144_2156 [Hymenobacter roseosalivarius DSM 11622]